MDAPPKRYYPSLYIEGGPELLALPEAGELEITVKRVSRTETDRNGASVVRVEYEVHAVEAESAVEEVVEETAEQALRRIAKEVLK